MGTAKTYTYELPADKQRLEQDARTMAQKEVQDNYPRIYLERNDIENHARVLCEQALAAMPNVTNDPQAYAAQYVVAYTRAYEGERRTMDAEQ